MGLWIAALWPFTYLSLFLGRIFSTCFYYRFSDSAGQYRHGLCDVARQFAGAVATYEFLIICGSAFGAFILGNTVTVVKQVFGLIPQVILGSKVNKAMYLDVLGLVYDFLNKARREGFMSIEADVESPESSAIFRAIPLFKKTTSFQFYCRLFSHYRLGQYHLFELEALMDQEIEARLHELEAPSGAVGKVADAMPGFGIVAAVLVLL